MGLLHLLINDPFTFILLVIPLLYSIIIHELAHGWVAYRMGDPTAKSLGRLSLNPLKHLDPVGTIMLFIFGFGWAKPVPVNFNYLHNKRMGLIFVSSAGIIAICFWLLWLFSPVSPFIAAAFKCSDDIPLLPGANQYHPGRVQLIPIPPLDGSKILMGFAPADFNIFLSRLEPYGFFMISACCISGLWIPSSHSFAGLFWR